MQNNIPLPLPLKEIDKLEIYTVIDNYVDILLTDTPIVSRPRMDKKGKIQTTTLLAEHGLSLIINLFRKGEKETILFDTGYSDIGVLSNLNMLGIDPDSINAMVLSHGHMDHTGSLNSILDSMQNKISLVAHPDIFLYPRYIQLEDGIKRTFPQVLTEEKLKQKNIDLILSRTPTLLADDTLLVTGEVERVTDFEKGLPNAFLEINGKTEKDNIKDDQSLVVNLKGKGLVVISGCSHSGIINTLFFARKITGIEKIHAVLGGFHLSGSFFEKILEKTIENLDKINPEIIVPMHCTGWKATKRFYEHFPDSFILNSVGSKYTLPGEN